MMNLQLRIIARNLLRFGVKFRYSIRTVSEAPPSSKPSGLRVVGLVDLKRRYRKSLNESFLNVVPYFIKHDVNFTGILWLLGLTNYSHHCFQCAKTVLMHYLEYFAMCYLTLGLYYMACLYYLCYDTSFQRFF